MKRFFVIIMAIACEVICSEGFAKKPTRQTPAAEKEAIKDSLAKVELKEKQQLDSLQKVERLKELEMEMQRKEELYRAKLENARKAAMAEEEVVVPCSKEAQSDDEYYGALGKGEGHNMSLAMIDATQKAQFELFKLVGEELVDDKVEKVCQIYYQDKFGMFNVFVALRYPKQKKDKE